MAAEEKSEDRVALEALFTANMATPEQADLLATALQAERTIKTINSFYVYFKSFSLKEWVVPDESREEDGPLFVCLDQAWQAAKDVAEAKEKEILDE